MLSGMLELTRHQYCDKFAECSAKNVWLPPGPIIIFASVPMEHIFMDNN